MIDDGFHSYDKSLCIYKIILGRYYVIYSKSVPGFLLDYLSLKNPICKGQFIIPKGSKYYENEYGEIVSNQIKFINARKINSNIKYY